MPTPATPAHPPRKAVVLAGGLGTRLGDRTRHTSKHLLPVAGQPMVRYPLALLARAGLHETLLVTRPEHLDAYHDCLGTGAGLGLDLRYTTQATPAGIPHAFALAAPFLGDAPAVLALADNLFFDDLAPLTTAIASAPPGTATVFTKTVPDPSRYGVAELAPDGHHVRSVEEKPAHPKSHHAVTGLYLLPPGAAAVAAGLQPSARGETEVTDLLQHYLGGQSLSAVPLPDTTRWVDAGTPETLAAASALAAAHPYGGFNA